MSSSSSLAGPWKESQTLPRNEKFLTLRSNDDQEFTVKESVAFKSPTIKNMAKQGGGTSVIYLPKVEGKILAMVLECLNVTFGDSGEVSLEDRRKYEPEELAKKELNDLLDAYTATYNYLEIKELSEIFYQAVRTNIDNIELPEAPELPDLEDYPTLEEDEAHFRTEYPSDFDD